MGDDDFNAAFEAVFGKPFSKKELGLSGQAGRLTTEAANRRVAERLRTTLDTDKNRESFITQGLFAQSEKAAEALGNVNQQFDDRQNEVKSHQDRITRQLQESRVFIDTEANTAVSLHRVAEGSRQGIRDLLVADDKIRAQRTKALANTNAQIKAKDTELKGSLRESLLKQVSGSLDLENTNLAPRKKSGGDLGRSITSDLVRL